MQPLPPITAKVDSALVKIDNQIDWLHYLSPLDNDAIWQEFVESGYRSVPTLRYPALPAGYESLCQELEQLPLDDIEDPLVHILLQEKQIELKLQLDLVLARGRPEFTALSTELFGGLEPSLTQVAKKILSEVKAGEPEEEQYVGCDEILAAAEQEFAYYREQAPDLLATAQAEADLNSMMMVHHGHFRVASSVCIPKSRVAPLMAHEIGTHVVTRYNGSLQPLKQFEVGLAHYDALQEGLGTLAEYLAGYLPARRLRVIAARVIASDAALAHHSISEIFAELHEQYHVPADDAFDIAVRACRGGGLTKDSVYLKGLRDLLAYLASGEDLAFLHLGKFAMEQRQVIKELSEREWVQPPRLIPRHLQNEAGTARLQRVRDTTLESLFQMEPEP